MTNRKLHIYTEHTCYQLVQTQRPWMTLNGHFALWFKVHAFSEPTTKISTNLNEDISPMLSAERCIRAMTVGLFVAKVSGYSPGFLGDEA